MTVTLEDLEVVEDFLYRLMEGEVVEVDCQYQE